MKSPDIYKEFQANCNWCGGIQYDVVYIVLIFLNRINNVLPYPKFQNMSILDAVDRRVYCSSPMCICSLW